MVIYPILQNATIRLGTDARWLFSNALKTERWLSLTAHHRTNEPYTAHKGILPMSEPPVTSSWEFDQNRFIPVAKTSESKPGPIAKSKPDHSPLLGLAVMAIAAVLSGTAFFWLVGQAFNEWSADRETSARTELARIRSCIN